jgi:hypothetical protein
LAQVQTSALFGSAQGIAEALSSLERAVKLLLTPTVNTIARKWVLAPAIDLPQPTNRFVFRVIP